jgi:hypothetical protein
MCLLRSMTRVRSAENSRASNSGSREICPRELGKVVEVEKWSVQKNTLAVAT